MIKYKMNKKKLVQVVKYFLKENGGSMDYRKLMSMLYLADREALEKWDTTITKDTYRME